MTTAWAPITEPNATETPSLGQPAPRPAVPVTSDSGLAEQYLEISWGRSTHPPTASFG